MSKFASALSRGCFAFAVLSAAAAGEAAAAAAQADFVYGSVTVAGPDGREQPLARGAELNNGDTVRTAQARAQLRFSDGGRDSLSEREGEVLRYLAQRPGRVVSRAELLEKVWRLPANRVQTRTIDMLVARLRDKLRDDATVPRIIQTVRGKGYVWL